jgi:hypothetical protein
MLRFLWSWAAFDRKIRSTSSEVQSGAFSLHFSKRVFTASSSNVGISLRQACANPLRSDDDVLI